jgi:hypothetical protein
MKTETRGGGREPRGPSVSRLSSFVSRLAILFTIGRKGWSQGQREDLDFPMATE